MPIMFTETAATLADILTVEEAESLLEWLLAHPEGELDLSELTHLHTANLQVLIAANPKISVWPQDNELGVWLRRSLTIGD